MKKLAFDIGANNGEFCKILLNHYEKIVCFEPIKECLLQIKSSDFYDPQRIILENIAISNHNNNQIMYICQDYDGNPCYAISSLSEDWKAKSRFADRTIYHKASKKNINCHIFKKTIDVKCNTLNSIIKKYGIPDFIKIDVEGYEHIILKNFDQLLENTIFCFEWVEEFKNELITTVEYLHKLGYKNFYCLQEDKYLESVEEWKDKDTFLDFNSLCENRKQLWGMIYFKK